MLLWYANVLISIVVILYSIYKYLCITYLSKSE